MGDREGLNMGLEGENSGVGDREGLNMGLEGANSGVGDWEGVLPRGEMLRREVVLDPIGRFDREESIGATYWSRWNS